MILYHTSATGGMNCSTWNILIWTLVVKLRNQHLPESSTWNIGSAIHQDQSSNG